MKLSKAFCTVPMISLVAMAAVSTFAKYISPSSP